MITVNIKRNRGGGDTSPLLLYWRKKMPIKFTLATSNGSDYPYKLVKSWGHTFDNSTLSKFVLESNTETSYTSIKYFADEDALATYRSDNADVITSGNVKKAANSLSVTRTVETVDSIP